MQGATAVKSWRNVLWVSSDLSAEAEGRRTEALAKEDIQQYGVAGWLTESTVV